MDNQDIMGGVKEMRRSNSNIKHSYRVQNGVQRWGRLARYSKRKNAKYTNNTDNCQCTHRKQHMFKSLFDVVPVDTEGTLICGVYLNVAMNRKSQGSQTQLSRCINMSLAEMEIIVSAHDPLNYA